MIAIVDAMLPEALSPQAEYLLASETANAGRVLLSRAPQAGPEQCRAAIAHLDRALEACKCSRRFAPDEILTRDWAALTDADLAQIAACGMRQASCEKLQNISPIFSINCGTVHNCKTDTRWLIVFSHLAK